MFYLSKPGSLFLVKMILTKDAGLWYASLLKMPLYQRYFLPQFASENQQTIWILYAWNIGRKWVKKQLNFKHIMHLSVIAQNQICIGLLCLSYLEKVFDNITLIYPCFSTCIYHNIFWSFEKHFKNINKCSSRSFLGTLLVKS